MATAARTHARGIYLTPRPLPSGTAHRSRTLGRSVAAFVLGFVLVIAGSHAATEEFGLRFCQPWRFDHMHKVWYFQRQVENPGIVYLGTSQIYDGVMPVIVERELAGHGVAVPPGYNLAVPGADLGMSWILARDLLQGKRKPRLVVLGVFPLVMAAGTPGAPEFFTRYASLADIAERIGQGRLGSSAMATGALRGLENLLQWPVYTLKKPIRKYRGDFLAEGRGAAWLESDISMSTPPHPATWDEFARKRKLDLTTRLPFCDDSEPAELLRRFRRLAIERGFQLVILLPPQGTEPDDLEKRFHLWMPAFCHAEGVLYWSMHDPAEYPRAEFQDPLHLNARGAAHFSKNLGQRLAGHARELGLVGP